MHGVGHAGIRAYARSVKAHMHASNAEYMHLVSAATRKRPDGCTAGAVAVLLRPRPSRARPPCPSRRAARRALARHRGLEAAVDLPVGARRRRRPSSSRRRGRRDSAAPSAVVSSTLRPHDRHAEHVGLELHQQVVGRGAAVDAQLGERDARRPSASPRSTSALWKAIDFERGARDVRRRSRRASGRRSRRARTDPSAARRGRRTPARDRRRRCRARSRRAPRPRPRCG